MSGDAPSISPEHLEAIYRQAREEFPRECCGYIRGVNDEAELVRCKNEADRWHKLDPETYPRTYTLTQGGAQDEQRFKVFARNAQHRTLAWFNAYPDLSVQNILQNAEVRRKLFTQMETDAEVEAWLRLLTRHAKQEAA